MRGASFPERLRMLGATEADGPYVEHFLAMARTHGMGREDAEQRIEAYFRDLAPQIASGKLDQAGALNQVFEGIPEQHAAELRTGIEEISSRGIEAVYQTPTAEADAGHRARIERIMREEPARYHKEGLAAVLSDILARQAADPAPEPQVDEARYHEEVEQMGAEQRVKEINRIMREDPGRYWKSQDLQRELRENLASMHGAPAGPALDENVFAIGPGAVADAPDSGGDASGADLGPAHQVL